jgi:hypothetical protein
MLTTTGVAKQKKVLKEQLTYLKKKRVTGISFSVGGKAKTAPELAELLKVKLLELPPLVMDVAPEGGEDLLATSPSPVGFAAPANMDVDSQVPTDEAGPTISFPAPASVPFPHTPAVAPSPPASPPAGSSNSTTTTSARPPVC